MFYYSAYNLRIASELPLPEFAPAGRGGDVEIRLRAPRRLQAARAIEWGTDTVRFCYPNAAEFIVRGGDSVEIFPEPSMDLPLLRLYIQGMIFAALLRQRGLFVLHASVVEAGDSVIAFVGPVGAGKSTLAAAFHLRGARVLADDNAALQWRATGPIVMPAFPSIKIYPDVAAAIGYERDGLQVMHRSQKKRAQVICGGFLNRPSPIEAIYVLDRNAAPAPQALTPVESMVEMIRHSVPTRWGVAGDAAHLETSGRFARAIPMFRVRTFRNLEEIPQVIDCIGGHRAEGAGSLTRGVGM